MVAVLFWHPRQQALDAMIMICTIDKKQTQERDRVLELSPESSRVRYTTISLCVQDYMIRNGTI